jgi:hypothetical protein
MLPRGGIYSPVTSVTCSWLDDYWQKSSAISRHAFNGCYHTPFNTYTSVISEIILTHQDFNGAKQT